MNMTPELKTILDDIGVNNGLSHTSEYLVREFLLAINQRNLDDVGDNGIAEVTDDPALQVSNAPLHPACRPLVFFKIL